ncbi:MAG: response regulator [Chloroflexota bacterium]
MASLRVLVVDDQHDVRRVLATGIRTLGADLEVMEMPSGEEAILEATRHSVDLLVTDVRLPGISGLELVNRIRRRSPEMHVILVTGVEESSVRRQITEAGADAFFYKPIHMADFLSAVESSLGLKDEGFVSPPAAKEEKEDGNAVIVAPPPSIKWISDLRKELDALAVILIDILGQVEARAGDLPDPSLEDEWLKLIASVLGSTNKIFPLLKGGKPSGFLYFNGAEYCCCVMYLGKSHAALIFSKHAFETAQFEIVQEYAKLLEMDVQALSMKPDDLEMSFEERPADEDAAEELSLEDLPIEALPELDAIFSQVQEDSNGGNADSFWEELAGQESGAEGAFGPKTLTYEQAMKLGLTPGEEKQEQKDEEN